MPSRNETPAISQNADVRLRVEEPDDQRDQRQRQPDIDDVPGRQHDRRAAHAAGKLQKRDHRAGEGDGADRDAERHFDQALAADGARRRRCRRPPARKARRPRPAPPPCRPASGRRRPVPASRSSARDARSPRRAAANRHAATTSTQARDRCRRCDASVVTMAIAMPIMPNMLPRAAGFRIRQPAQRQNEQDAGDQIKAERRRDLALMQACAFRHLFLLWNMREHALR